MGTTKKYFEHMGVETCLILSMPKNKFALEQPTRSTLFPETVLCQAIFQRPKNPHIF